MFAKIFKWSSQVRDYELDLQKIVNNSVYMNYLEHARHQALLELGYDFVDLHNLGYDLVLAKSELKFKRSLRSQNDFEVQTQFSYEGGLKIFCHQQIFFNNLLILEANHVIVSVLNENSKQKPGKIFLPEFLREKFHKISNIV